MNNSKKKNLVQHLLTIALVPVLIVVAGYLSIQFKTDFDWTYGGRNTLTQDSRDLLSRMPDPITFTAYSPADSEIKREITGDLMRYKREKDNIVIEFVDPSREPERTRAAGVTAFNEVVVEYQGRTETLRALTEPAITTALQRIADTQTQNVVFLQGHGERRIEGDDPTTMSAFANAMRERGLNVRSLNLAQEPGIPSNTSVLVLASPQRRLLEGEQNLIGEWLKAGGNLVWMADPDSPAQFEPITDVLGVTWHDGVAVFADYQSTSGHPGIFLAAGYPPSPLTQRLDEITVFPLVRSLELGESDWRAMPFLVTPGSAWLETGAIEGNLVLDEDAGDIPGPLTIGATLSRNIDVPDADGETQTREQRVVLIGDADFATDVYFGEVGNSRLALNIMQWAATRDAQLDINVPTAPDASLYVPGWAMVVISVGFVIVLPLLLLGFGIVRWAIRRRR
jgi:ABC-type uncharacterized transport system involved in gliding motility auxiliary subunit